MKKIMWFVFMFCALSPAASVYAGAPSFVPKADLTAQDVVVHLDTFLPTDIGEFSSQEEKDKAGKAAQRYIAKYNNYLAYYNAAVVYAAAPDSHAEAFVRVRLTERDEQNAIRYATKAISLSPKTPQMYLVRGSVYYRQGTMPKIVEAGLDILSHDYAKKALADFEKVSQLHRVQAPYRIMADLAEALHQPEKAALYRKVAQELDEKARQAKAEEAKKEVKEGMAARLLKRLSRRSVRAN